MKRNHTVTVYLTTDEREWLRRKAHWSGVSISEILREHVHSLIREDGYLRPPDDEHQDFGYEKEMIELVNRVSEE
jgi:hypothetical protein